MALATVTPSANRMSIASSKHRCRVRYRAPSWLPRPEALARELEGDLHSVVRYLAPFESALSFRHHREGEDSQAPPPLLLLPLGTIHFSSYISPPLPSSARRGDAASASMVQRAFFVAPLAFDIRIRFLLPSERLPSLVDS